MKPVIHCIQIGILTLLTMDVASAEEKNFGTMTPTQAEVIQHFKAPVKNSEPSSGQASDGYEDVSESDLQNVRGLKKTVNLDKIKIDKPKVARTSGEKAISLQILFDYDSAALSEEAKHQLDPVGQALASGELKGLKFKIEGHTDAVGSDEYNNDLSRRRADAVKQFLVDQYGIPLSALQSEGKGKSGLADSSNPNSEVNRRVRIVGLSGE